MTADVVPLRSKPAKREPRWGSAIPFNAKMAVFDQRIPMRGPETLIRLCRQALDDLEAKVRCEGEMDAGDVYTLQVFVLGQLFYIANGRPLPALK